MKLKKEKIKNWLLSSLTGILLITFGIISIAVPTVTIVTLAYYFAISIMAGGLFLAFVAFRVRSKNDRWNYLLLEGTIGVILGLIILLKPEAAAAIFVVIVGIWAFLLGLIFMVHYFRRVLPMVDKTMLILGGGISALVGILLIINPFEGSRALAVIIGVYAVFYGVLSIISKQKIHFS